MFETFEDVDQAKQALLGILEAVPGWVFIEAEDNPTKVANIRVVDVVVAHRDNLWDDQHDGGAHKDDLLEANRLLLWLGYAELCDDYRSWSTLPSDEETEAKYERL